MYFNNQTLYDSAEWTQATATNYDVSAQTLFVNCKPASHIIIRADQAITVRFNSVTNPAITVSANTSFELDLNVTSMFVTTTTSTAIKVVLTK